MVPLVSDFSSRPAPRRLVIATIVLAIAAAISALPALMSLMLFDAPGSEQNSYLVMTAAGLLSFPPMCVVAIALAWVAHAAGRERASRRVLLLPLVSVLVFAIGFTLVAIVCHGEFVCRAHSPG